MRIITSVLLILSSILLFAQSSKPIMQDGKWGYQGADGEWLVKPKFEGAQVFSEGVAGVKIKGLWGVINAEGKFVVKPMFQEVKLCKENRIAVKSNNLWGFFNAQGIQKIDYSFDKVLNFKNGQAIVTLPGMLKKHKMLINLDGKQITPPFLKRVLQKGESDVYKIISKNVQKDSIFCYVNGQGDYLTAWYLTNFKWNTDNQKVESIASRKNENIPGNILQPETERRLFAFLDANNNIASDWYEEVKEFNQGVAAAKMDHRFGFINDSYETIVEFKYLDIQHLGKMHYNAQRENNSFVICDASGRVISSESSGFDVFDDDYFVGSFLEDYNGVKTYKKALFDKNGNQKSGWFNEIYPKSNAYYRVVEEVRMVLKDNIEDVPAYNFIVDSTGEILSDWRPCFEIEYHLEKGKWRDSLWKYMHQPNTHYYLDETFFEDVFYMELDHTRKKQSLNFNGGDFHDGMAVVAKVDFSRTIENKNGGVSFVKPAVKYGVIDWYGDLVIPYKYEYLSGFSDGKALYKQGDKFGVINYTGKVISSPKFNLIGNFGNGLAPVYKDSLWGYANTSGAVLIQPQYDEAMPYRYGYAAVKQGKKWGVINVNGTLVFDFKYRKPPKAVSRKQLEILKDGIGYVLIDLP